MVWTNPAGLTAKQLEEKICGPEIARTKVKTKMSTKQRTEQSTEERKTVKLYSFYFEVRDGEEESGYHKLVLSEDREAAEKQALDYVLHFYGEMMHPDSLAGEGHYTGGGADYRIVEFYGDVEEVLNPAQKIVSGMAEDVINRPKTGDRILLQMLLASRGFLPKYSVDKITELIDGLDGAGIVVTDTKLLKSNLKTMLDGLTLAALTEGVPKETD